MSKQEYRHNKNARIYNCNICADVQLIMIDDQDAPTGGCRNPDCPSNESRDPVPGMKLEYQDYSVEQRINRIMSKIEKALIIPEW